MSRPSSAFDVMLIFSLMHFRSAADTQIYCTLSHKKNANVSSFVINLPHMKKSWQNVSNPLAAFLFAVIAAQPITLLSSQRTLQYLTDAFLQ